MKQLQIKNLVGFLRISILGRNPEFLLNYCKNEQIPIWDIIRVSKDKIVVSIYPFHFNKLADKAEANLYTVKIKKRIGLISFIHTLRARKEFIVAFILSAFVLYILSSVIWDVRIEGVTTEVESKLAKRLHDHGLIRGALVHSLDPIDKIQQELVNEIPELLYIGIKQRGRIYVVEGIEKQLIPKKEKLENQHLVANKNGIIEKMFIKRGNSVVKINDYVKRGDLLVSGILHSELSEDEEENDAEKIIVAAEGKVFATTWYEIDVSSSLFIAKERLTGKKKRAYELHVGSFKISFPIRTKASKKDEITEEEIKQWTLFGNTLPLTVIEKTTYDKNEVTDVRTIETAKEMAINEAIKRLKLSLGEEAEIKKYYVLHETVDNGKVKLYLYISVLENIAKGRLIST